MVKKIEKITLAAGCFWCIEAAFNNLSGVVSAISGYTDGKTKNPTYKGICTGETGHAEAVQIIYDESIISLQEILDVFFHLHDPTQLNRQGNDIGTQYRSAIYFHTEQQKDIANNTINELTQAEVWPSPIVTEVKQASIFYSAEAYHQEYADNNPNNPYCQMVVMPKLGKFRHKYYEKLKH